MIGKPLSLSLSLYRKLITDNAWRIARERMGYCVPKGQPLMVSLAGQPFIDTRLSFHSYLPKGLPSSMATKLVHEWIERLKKNPQLHDKVEFDVAITTFTFDLDEQIAKLGLSLNEDEREVFKKKLIELFYPLISGNGQGSIKEALDIEYLSKIELPVDKPGLWG